MVLRVIDPTLEHDLMSSTKPWALSPLISTMPHFMHERTVDSLSPPSSSRSSLICPNAEATPKASTFPDAITKAPHSHSFPPFPPNKSIEDDNSQLHLTKMSLLNLPSSSTSSLSSVSSEMSLKSTRSTSSLKVKMKNGDKYPRAPGQPFNLQNASDRRSYFSVAKNRKEIIFGPNVRYVLPRHNYALLTRPHGNRTR